MVARFTTAWLRVGASVALSALWLSACSAPLAPTDGVSVHVKSVRVDPRTAAPVVLLQEDHGQRRSLPIWIGPYEAQSIALGLDQDFSAQRPNTHDLIANLIDGIEGRLARVVITELVSGTYFAVIVVEVGGRSVRVDSRPSDAIAVALRTRTPLYATDRVLRQAASSEPGGTALEIGLDRRRSEPNFDEIRSY